MPQTGSAISVKNLTKTFKGGLKAVDDISFEVPKGSIFAFLGPNGAGKTTTIKMLTTLLHPTSGTLELNGMDPVKSPHDVRQSFGIVFQDPSLDDELTANDTFFHAGLLCVPRAETPKKIEDLMTFVELWDRRASFAKTFSGGMKRRLEIARALLHTPQILFLDEPTLGLDPQTRNHIWGYIRSLVAEQKMTVFFTTHYMEEAERSAQKVAVIDHGKIIASDTPANIISAAGTTNLEDAFIKLTGRAIREQEAGKSGPSEEYATSFPRRQTLIFNLNP